MKKFLIFISLIIFSVAIFFVFKNSSNKQNPNLTTDTSMPIEGELPIDPNTLTINLTDVANGNSTGEATILRRDNTVFHTVVANLPTLEAGFSYEGWLVRRSPFAFISTGVMTQELDTEFSLIYENLETDLENYDQVVITLESVVDETPEDHILEGSF